MLFIFETSAIKRLIKTYGFQDSKFSFNALEFQNDQYSLATPSFYMSYVSICNDLFTCKHH